MDHSVDHNAFEVVVDSDRHLFRLRPTSILEPAILLSASAVFVLIGVSIVFGSVDGVMHGIPIVGASLDLVAAPLR
jgi:hypothetical protein